MVITKQRVFELIYYWDGNLLFHTLSTHIHRNYTPRTHTHERIQYIDCLCSAHAERRPSHSWRNSFYRGFAWNGSDSVLKWSQHKYFIENNNKICIYYAIAPVLIVLGSVWSAIHPEGPSMCAVLFIINILTACVWEEKENLCEFIHHILEHYLCCIHVCINVLRYFLLNVYCRSCYIIFMSLYLSTVYVA